MPRNSKDTSLLDAALGTTWSLRVDEAPIFQLRFSDVAIGDRPAWVAVRVVKAKTAEAPGVVAALDWFGDAPATLEDLEGVQTLRLLTSTGDARPPSMAMLNKVDPFSDSAVEVGVTDVPAADVPLAARCTQTGGRRSAMRDLAFAWIGRFEPERHAALMGAKRVRPAPKPDRSVAELTSASHLESWNSGAQREARPRVREILSACVRDITASGEDALRVATLALNEVGARHPGSIETSERDQLFSLLSEIGRSSGVANAAGVVDRHREW